MSRRYTLPGGVTSWNTLSGFDSAGDERFWDDSVIFYPLLWNQAINDQFTLIWSPLPVEGMWELVGPESGEYLGLKVSLLGPSHFRSKDFVWRPALELERKLHLTESVFLKNAILIQPEIRPKRKNNKIAWTFGASLEPSTQVNSEFAIGLLAQILYERDFPRAFYYGDSPSDVRDSELRFPIGLQIFIWLSDRIETSAGYTYFDFGYRGEFRGHRFLLETAYFY